MKLFRTTLTAALLAAAVHAEPIVKVTFKSSSTPDDLKMSQVSKLVFSSDGFAAAGKSYLFSDIAKITFTDDGTAIQDNFRTAENPISFGMEGGRLNLTLEKSQMVTVRMYSLNGRMVKELFSGINPGKSLSLDYDGVAQGVYSVVVRMGSDLLARKIVIK